VDGRTPVWLVTTKKGCEDGSELGKRRLQQGRAIVTMLAMIKIAGVLVFTVFGAGTVPKHHKSSAPIDEAYIVAHEDVCCTW
jgi:hypothetical protein